MCPIYSQSLDSELFSGYHEKWAFMVGISDYSDPAVPYGPYAVESLKDMRNFLINDAKFKSDHVFFVSNKNATRKNIVEGVNKLINNHMASDDLFIFYYAGHGGCVEDPHDPMEKDGYEELIFPYDGAVNNYSSIITDHQICKLFEDLKVKNSLFIFDTCSSGGIDLNLSCPYLIVRSCKEDEDANAYKDIGRMIFTYYFIEGLKNSTQNKESSFIRACDYAIPLVAKKTNNTQHPNYKFYKNQI